MSGRQQRITVGGMLIGTIALLFVVPALFIIFQTIEEKVMPKRERPQIAEESSVE